MNLDASDDATGLPPMQHDLDYALLAISGAGGGEGILTIPGRDETVAVKYLHLRGLVRQAPNSDEADWAQTTIAIPAEMIPAVLAALAS